MERKALVIGISKYADVYGEDLKGPEQDVNDMAEVLAHHGFAGRRRNWHVTPLIDQAYTNSAGEAKRGVNHDALAQALRNLFDANAGDELLLYFAGHGIDQADGSELLTSDGQGYKFDTLMTLIDRTKAARVTVILDCCVAGGFANRASYRSVPGSAPFADPFQQAFAHLKDGVTILASSMPLQSSAESNRSGTWQGAFTSLMVSGLRGAAADLQGRVTSLGLYEYASEAFSVGKQRPMVKAHLASPTLLREVEPPVDPVRLERIAEIFPNPDSGYVLSMKHEGGPENGGGLERGRDTGYQPFQGTDEQNVLDHLKEWRDAGLVRGEKGEDFWFLCKNSGSASLTATGKYVWQIMSDRRRGAS